MTENLPPYQRLQSGLSDVISSTPAGERLPSEPDLARQLGVSRATLREAMRAFEGQGLIRRRQGVGTFVVGHSQVLETGLEILESIETLADRSHLVVTMGDFHLHEIFADQDLAEALGIDENVPLRKISRVILAENRPVAFLIDILPADVIQPDELQGTFTGSVLDLLLSRGDLSLSHSRTEIRAVDASPEVARALEIQRGDGLLNFIASLYTMDGRVIDYSFSYFLPGYFRFYVMRSIGKKQAANWSGITPGRKSA